MKKGEMLITGNCVRCTAILYNGRLRCDNCGKWNTEVFSTKVEDYPTLDKIKPNLKRRLATGPWDYMFGPTRAPYGIPHTYTLLIGGGPGAGKSTWILQIADGFLEYQQRVREVLYVAAEEAEEDIQERAARLELKHWDMIRPIPALTGAIDLPKIIERYKPGLIFLDSLQGFVGQDDAASVEICRMSKRFAVEYQAPVVLINTLTKDGELSGLNVLQHAVDATYLLTVDPETGLRTLEAMKNRGGRAQITCDFEMAEKGLLIVEREEDEDE